MSGSFQIRAWIALALAYASSAIVFSVWPEIDLAVSGLFYSEDSGFFWADNILVQAGREITLLFMRAVFGIAVVLTIAGYLGWKLRGIRPAVWFYISLVFIVGPGLLVNSVLKANWGRARPSQILEFGGTANFSPALQVTDECARNCSFVSGEGAGATALALTILILAPVLLPIGRGGKRKLQTAVLLLLPALALILRVATGRHFLSDTVFAVLIVLTVALVLVPFFFRHKAPPYKG